MLLKWLGTALHPRFILDALKVDNFPTTVTEYIVNAPLDDSSSDLPSIETRKVQQKDRPLETPSSAASTSSSDAKNISSLPSDTLQLISGYLPSEEGSGLWTLGDKPLQQKLSQLHTVRLVPPVASTFHWPSTALSHFPNAKDVTIACPEFYEHLPFENFSAKDIPSRVQKLTLTFRNAANLFREAPKLRAKFPELESLTIDGNDGPKISFTSHSIETAYSDPDDVRINHDTIQGLSHLNISKLEILLSDIEKLPQSLLSLQHIKVTDYGDVEPGYIPKWPKNLQILSVDAERFGGAVMSPICFGSGKLEHLTHLTFACVQELHSAPPMVDDETISCLPSTLIHLDLSISGTKAKKTDADQPPLSADVLLSVPKFLESLIIRQWPVDIDLSKFAEMPAIELKTLRILQHKRKGFSSYEGLPESITDLTLHHQLGQEDQEEFGENLSLLPPHLTRLWLSSLKPDQFSSLPSTLTDLTLDYITINEPWTEEDDTSGYPPLKRLHINFFEDEAYWPFDKICGQLEDIHLNSHRPMINEDDEPYGIEEYALNENWKHFSDGVLSEGELWAELTERLPRTLKSYRIPFSECSEPLQREGLIPFLEKLPKSLTALSLVGADVVTDANVLSKVPPHLTYLEVMHLTDATPEHLAKLPKTLRTISAFNTNQIPSEGLPPFCKTADVQYSCPRSLEGQWWRFCEDKPIEE